MRRSLVIFMAVVGAGACHHSGDEPASAHEVSVLTSVPAPAAPPSASVAAVPAPPPAPENPSPFRDAVVSYPDPDEAQLPNGLRLCPMNGRTFVCGVSDVPMVSSADGVDLDIASRPRRPLGDPFDRGPLVDAPGTWPGDAWAVGAAWGTLQKFALHYEHGAWAAGVTWGSYETLLTAPFQGGLLVADALLRPDSTDTRTAPLTLFRRGGSREIVASPFPDVDALASAGGAVFLVGAKGGSLSVARWTGAGSAAKRVDAVLPLGDDQRFHQPVLWVRSATDAVLAGSVGDGHKSPLFFRWDGKTWTRGELPQGTTHVDAYDRLADGTERIFAHAGETLSLFARHDGAWRPIALPTLPEGDRIQRVWLANDDAWLLVWPHDSTTNPPHLMRMQPVKHVWRFPSE